MNNGVLMFILMNYELRMQSIVYLESAYRHVATVDCRMDALSADKQTNRLNNDWPVTEVLGRT